MERRGACEESAPRPNRAALEPRSYRKTTNENPLRNLQPQKTPVLQKKTLHRDTAAQRAASAQTLHPLWMRWLVGGNCGVEFTASPRPGDTGAGQVATRACRCERAAELVLGIGAATVTHLWPRNQRAGAALPSELGNESRTSLLAVPVDPAGWRGVART